MEEIMTSTATLSHSDAAVPALEVTDLAVSVRKSGEDHVLVQGVSFTVEPGEIVGLIGESGSGKTLTAKSVLRMLPDAVTATRGSIAVQGQNVLDMKEGQLRQLRGRTISAVFQDPLSSLNPVMKIGDQVVEAICSHGGVTVRDARLRAIELLTAVGITEPARRMGQYPHEFSGGMRQRVCIAMSIAHGPALLVADEPTTAVDVTVQAQILRTLLSLRDELQLSMLLITHDIGVVAEICDRVVVMRGGRMIEEGRTADVLRAPREQYTRDLIDAVPSIDDPLLNRAPVTTAPVVHAERVSITVGHRSHPLTILDDATLQIAPGETVGVVGESGSGKTTLARTIAGFLPPSTGQILLNGERVGTGREDLRRLRRDVQYVFQDPFASLDPTMTIRESLEEALAFGNVAARQRNDVSAQLMRDVGLDPAMLERRPRAFSGGQRQRIVIARALAVRPRVLVCDEAVSALDVSVQARILTMLRELQEQTHVGILFISHDLAVVRSISDRVVVMRGGRIVEQGTARQIYEDPQEEYTRTLLDSSLSARVSALTVEQALPSEDSHGSAQPGQLHSRDAEPGFPEHRSDRR